MPLGSNACLIPHMTKGADENIVFFCRILENFQHGGHAASERAMYSSENDTIYQALGKTNYNKAKAAKLLGIHRTLLYKKMKEYNIGLKPE